MPFLLSVRNSFGTSGFAAYPLLACPTDGGGAPMGLGQDGDRTPIWGGSPRRVRRPREGESQV